MNQVTVISGVERRRIWSEEQKRALVAAAFSPGARVSEVAARADVRTCQLYRWRRALAATAASAGFAPVMVLAEEERITSEESAPERSAVIEQVASACLVIEMDGAVLRATSDAPPALVTAALKVLGR